jgi:hypothetical protein
MDPYRYSIGSGPFVPVLNIMACKMEIKLKKTILFVAKAFEFYFSIFLKCFGSESKRIRNFLLDPNPNLNKNTDSDPDTAF